MPPQNTNANEPIVFSNNTKVKWEIIAGVVILIILILEGLYFYTHTIITKPLIVEEKAVVENKVVAPSIPVPVSQPAVVDENASSTKRLAEIQARVLDIDKEMNNLFIQENKVIDELHDLSSKGLSTSTKDAELNALVSKVKLLMKEKSDLGIEYGKIQADLNAKLVSGVGAVDMEAVYNKYCSGVVNINYKNTDYSSELTLKLAGLKIEDLVGNLAKGGVYADNQVPEALQYVGLKLMQAGKVDDSIKIYQCSTEKYFDMISMYRMARVYQDGTAGIKKQLTTAVITNEIVPDLKQTYYWITAIFYVESVEKTGKLSASTQFGWNTIAILDDLQNTGKLTDKEMTEMETKAVQFVSKRYPEILNSSMTVGAHKL